MELKEKVRKKLSDYLQFNVDELYQNKDMKFSIFGGAIRDSIADKNIHDIDILCLPKASQYLLQLFIKKGFNVMSETNDISAMYKELRLIHQPVTLYKGVIKVQLIKANKSMFLNSPSLIKLTENDALLAHHIVLRNVDINVCGIYYENGRIVETIKDAINHCNRRTFYTLNTLMNNPDRIAKRIKKLKERGWKYLENKSQFKYL